MTSLVARRRSALGALLVALALSLCVRGARAWGYNEHYRLGLKAYQQVCAQLAPELTTPEQIQRYNVACGADQLMAHQYAQFAALSGDHLTLDKLRGLSANIAARNVVEYLALASHNAEHFHPQNVELWREHHTNALKQAELAASRQDYLEQLQEFWLGFYHSAFADHFLMDAFAAGHSGFNRPSSTPTAAYKFHKDLNNSGKLLRDSAGRQWRTFGDDNLTRSEDAEGELRVQKTATASVRDFLVTFVSGKRGATLERDVTLRIPTWANQLCTSELDDYYNSYSVPLNAAIDVEYDQLAQNALVRALGRVPSKADPVLSALSPAPADCRLDDQDPNDDRGWKSLLQIHEAARYAITHTFSLTHFGELSPNDAVWAPTYSFGLYAGGPRLGLDLGWYRSFRDDRNDGFLVALALSYPLGGTYGSVLSWDFDAKCMFLLPALSRHGAEFEQHVAPTAGLGMSAEFGIVNIRLSAGPAMVFSSRLGPGPDRFDDPAFGWYGQVGFHFIYAPRGGGPMRPWAF